MEVCDGTKIEHLRPGDEAARALGGDKAWVRDWIRAGRCTGWVEPGGIPVNCAGIQVEEDGEAEAENDEDRRIREEQRVINYFKNLRY